MNALLFHPNKETLDLLTFCLESQTGLDVQQTTSFQQAVEKFLEGEAIDLVITTQLPSADKLLKYILSTGADIPIILISEDDKKIETYPELKLLGIVEKQNLVEELPDLIAKNFSQLEYSPIRDEYCRISTELLVRVVPLMGDIYIRLSSVKFVKMFRSGRVFTSEDMERFLSKKKITHLYIKKTESGEFLQKFKSDLSAMVEAAKEGDTGLEDTVVNVQELVQELAQRIGFTREVQEMANENINLALKAIGASPRLSKVLSRSHLNAKNFISSHSMQLANIACSIASLMQWPSNTTFQKLVMASLFHDFSLTEPEWAKISTKRQLEELDLPITDAKFLAIKNHPTKCSEIIKTLHEVPGDVEVIVSHHHERPDGSGFPRGIRANQIAPLAAVLIVAHDVLDAIIRDGEAFDLKTFLVLSEDEYQHSSFKKVWKAMHLIDGGEAAA